MCRDNGIAGRRNGLLIATLVMAALLPTLAQAAGKVLRPDVTDPVEETPRASSQPVPQAPASAAATTATTSQVITPVSSGRPATATPPKIDPNTPLPLSERAAEAAARAKRALADEDGDSTESAAGTIAGQAIGEAEKRQKTARQSTPRATCLAGC
jgi:hypothetical protein